MRVLIVGAGWSGCAAAITAKKKGAHVILLERTDMILGTGLVGGIMRNNGRFTATEEIIAMGGGDLFHIIETNLRHKNISFPGHEHADLYDISTTPSAVYRYIIQLEIELHLMTRITQVTMVESTLVRVFDDKGNTYEADVFIDATGGAGPMNNCIKYGNGCAMCVLRCPTFGGRVSLTGLTGVDEIVGKREDGSIGAMSGSCKILKESLSTEITCTLNEKGVVIIPLKKEQMEDHLSLKACQQYALPDYARHLILLDTGHAKLMTPFYPIEKLHQLPGFENARYEDPYSAGCGNSMRFFAMCKHDNGLKVDGVNNLFCCGEKAGLLVGHTEAIVTGVLAGYNAVLYTKKQLPLILPRNLAIGEAIAFVNDEMKAEEGLSKKFTFSGSVLFQRLKEMQLYSTDVTYIHDKVRHLKLNGIFS